jgi:hypothetical protein
VADRVDHHLVERQDHVADPSGAGYSREPACGCGLTAAVMYWSNAITQEGENARHNRLMATPTALLAPDVKVHPTAPWTLTLLMFHRALDQRIQGDVTSCSPACSTIHPGLQGSVAIVAFSGMVSRLAVHPAPMGSCLAGCEWVS